ncbi:hypothetical protein POF50_035040 [Streptomyces sp. SL13]|uniref:Allene oxide cyclase barrel-like domain-containing protein n=1 Tax=Streptantibioticus silvisoli TaxID=2705255 RepID=A0AA90HAS0_9ACTN|nr:hypothetical protein [Streptantibioticus silvisoli]MDI5974506.1 hypothetical protein [Streptantibioticus silvisoli]
MQRSVLFKRGLAAFGAALAFAAATPSLASAAAGAIAPQPVVLDFRQDTPTAPTANSDFGEHGAVLDAIGQQVGGAVINCDDVAGRIADSIYCTGIIDFYQRGEIGFQVGTAVTPDGRSAPRIDGIITGGTEEFEGLTGELRLTTLANGVYRAEFLSAAH